MGGDDIEKLMDIGMELSELEDRIKGSQGDRITKMLTILDEILSNE